jgi:hypothetical protein
MWSETGVVLTSQINLMNARGATMADTRLKKIGPLRALQLCAYGAFFPKKLVRAEGNDEEARRHLPQASPPELPRAFKVTRGLWASLAWVIGAIAVGYLMGKALGMVSGPAPTRLVATLQVFGATVVLWATLFVRGWDIQSFGGVTLTERVNRWIYRLLYCLGTAAVVASLALP